jgi:uncharacterized protein YjiS (DUF1127 family)
MSCAYKSCSAPVIMQPPAPVWPARPAFMKALSAIADILQEAFELSRTCTRIAQRRRERQSLLELDDRLLDDVGVTRDKAERQSRKWFWQ